MKLILNSQQLETFTPLAVAEGYETLADMVDAASKRAGFAGGAIIIAGAHK